MNLTFASVIYLALAAKCPPVSTLPGCWEYSFGSWRIAMNGHQGQEVATTWGVKVPGLMVYVEFNEWPAGMLTAAGGVIAAGDVANKDAFIAALEAETVRLGGKLAREDA